jgi:hypothetical protein
MHLDFDLKPNGAYTREDFLNILSRIALNREYTNIGEKDVVVYRVLPFFLLTKRQLSASTFSSL